MLAPGFIDAQVNGGGGVLLNDEPTVDGIGRIAAAHRRFGTTALLPTLISDRRDVMRRAIRAVGDAIEAGVPGVLGIHLEGPFLHPGGRACIPPDHLVPVEAGDAELVSALGARGVTLVTLAPERVPPGFVADLVRRGVVVSAGHTDGTAADLRPRPRRGLAPASPTSSTPCPRSPRASRARSGRRSPTRAPSPGSSPTATMSPTSPSSRPFAPRGRSA